MAGFNIDENNSMRVRKIKWCTTTHLFDKFYKEVRKNFLIIDNIVSIRDASFYAMLNIIIAKDAGCRSVIIDGKEDPHLTISYLKLKSPLCYAKSFDYNDFCVNEIKEKYLLNAVLKIWNQIQVSSKGQIILFDKPIALYAQSAEDRKKGTFDGGNCHIESVKLYGETSYEYFIRGVEVSYIIR